MNVVKTFMYELDISYAPVYLFRSNGYLNYMSQINVVPHSTMNTNRELTLNCKL